MPDKIPFLQPQPARLSLAIDELRLVEDSGIYSNFGPVSRRLEKGLVDGLFEGHGQCVTVCNATLGLMLAVKQCVSTKKSRSKRYALMPSFTFAATAHAALWVGLTPLLCDIEPDTLCPSPTSEIELLERYGDDIAVVIPCATFGNTLDLAHYDRLAHQYAVPMVIDAAAALGTQTVEAKQFGIGYRSALVFSMHATKAFATAEAGVVYSGDTTIVHEVRQMANFGFDETRSVTMPGLNAKLSEVGALLAELKLKDLDAVLSHRNMLMAQYKESIPEFEFQTMIGQRHSYSFVSGCVPKKLAHRRDHIRAHLLAKGIETRTYFSPHISESPYFENICVSGELTVTADVCRRVISLPLFDLMTSADVMYVVTALRDAMRD